MSNARERCLRQMPWWLWPLGLCGVAPLAAWGWQGLFAQAANVRLPPVAHQVLALVVWVVAVADRLLEAPRSQRFTWRHWFMLRHRPYFVVALVAALIVLIRLLFWALPQVILEAGLFLVIPVGFYLFFARMEIGPKSALPREIVRGALFSAGVLLPTCGIASVPPAALQLMIAQTLLISLVFLSSTCRDHIDRPEEAPHREDWQAIDTRLGIWLFLLLGTVLWLAQVEARQASASMAGYYIAMAAVAIATGVLHGFRRRLSPDAVHAWCWVILCLPVALQWLR